MFKIKSKDKRFDIKLKVIGWLKSNRFGSVHDKRLKSVVKIIFWILLQKRLYDKAFTQIIENSCLLSYFCGYSGNYELFCL